MIAVITQNSTLLKHLNDLALALEVCDAVQEVERYDLVICEADDAVHLLQKNGVRLLVLSEKPNFVEAMPLLALGARGYGNIHMQAIHLSQALNTIKNDAVWLYPDMMSTLIAYGSKAVTSDQKEHLDKLSSREQEVALEIEKGKSNKEIANDLKITERTVKAHLSKVYEKLKVNDRLALALLLRS